ncbi:MAG TPA: hypothetical protein VIM58_05815 [Candidatus Methylacidiphilales bacterium]
MASSTAAEPESFSLRIEKGNLIVADLQGSTVAVVSPDTIGRQIQVGGYAFDVTYGRTPMGDLSVVVNASPSNPGGLSFSMNGRHVEMDRLATGVAVPVSVTITISTVAGRTQTTIEAPTFATVRVDGQPAPALSPSSVPVVADADLGTMATAPGATVKASELPLGNAFLDAPTGLAPTAAPVSVNFNAQAVVVATSPNPTTPF